MDRLPEKNNCRFMITSTCIACHVAHTTMHFGTSNRDVTWRVAHVGSTWHDMHVTTSMTRVNNAHAKTHAAEAQAGCSLISSKQQCKCFVINNSFTLLARALCQNHYPSVITEKRYRRGSEWR